MPNIFDFLEPLFSGNLKYFSGFVLGTLVVLIVRYLYIVWGRRQSLADQNFVNIHKGESIETFKKRSRIISYSLVILLVVVLPLLLFVSVKVLDSVMDVEPWLGVLVVLIEVCILIVLTIIQGVRGRRLRRRIKLLEKAKEEELNSLK